MAVMDIQQKVRLQIGDLFVQIMDLSTQLELANEEVKRLKEKYEPETEVKKPNGGEKPASNHR